jgi:hypothetical protein
MPRALALLVIDTDIATINMESSYIEKYLKITFSSWGSRLWTLYESLLAQRICFAFNSTATSLEDLVDERNAYLKASPSITAPRLLCSKLRAALREGTGTISNESMHLALSGLRTSNTRDTIILEQMLLNIKK